MKKTAAYLILFISQFVQGQAQVTGIDTSTFESNRSRKYERIEKTVFRADSLVVIDNSRYYTHFVDSLETTSIYLKRDIISTRTDFVFIHIAHKIGCYGVSYSHMFFYYNPKLRSKEKVIFLSKQGREKFFGFFNHQDLDSIINILNTNMAFNISDIGYEVLPDMRYYGTGSDEYNVLIRSKERNTFLKNEFVVYPNYFGFGHNTLSQLIQIGQINTNKQTNMDFKDFYEKDLRIFSGESFLIDMINIFNCNDERKLQF